MLNFRPKLADTVSMSPFVDVSHSVRAGKSLG